MFQTGAGVLEYVKREMFMNKDERYYAYWLCNLPGVGSRTIDKLLQLCGNAKGVYDAPNDIWEQIGRKSLAETACQKVHWDFEKEYLRMEEKGIRFLLQEDDEYPNHLREIPDPPFALFVKGEVPKEKRLSVAVIGARDCSEYGRAVAKELGRCLGECGVQVISGMARGIDGISQESCLRTGGISFGVLGSGVDVCYPKQNRVLYDRLLERGGIISEYVPGTMPRPQNFPPRNRIVSGLADVVVVIEARNKSGTLITVDMALEQGREVYVVPGRVTDRLSDGCNRLIKQGAGVILSPEDFVHEIYQISGQGTLGENANETKGADEKLISILPPELREVYKALDFYPQSVEQIFSKVSKSFSITELHILLMRLCMENHAIQLSTGQFCAKR